MSLINWEIDINKIDELINKLIKDTRKRCEDIIKSSSTKDVNILKDLNDLERLFGNDLNYINILKSAHPIKEIRDKCTESVKELSKLSIEISMNEDLYKKLEQAKRDLNNDLDGESKRYLDRTLLKKRLNGN